MFSVPPLLTRPSLTIMLDTLVSFGWRTGQGKVTNSSPCGVAPWRSLSPRHAVFDTCETFLLSYITQHLKPNRASDSRGDSNGGMVMIPTAVHVGLGSFYFFGVFPVAGNALWGPCSLFLILTNKFHIGNKVYFLMEINLFGWRFCYGFLFSRSLCVSQLSLPWLVLILSPSPPSTSLVLPLL